jgi:hypothetical protein
MRKKNIKYCENCKNKSVVSYQLKIGGQGIDLCITCWLGICMGLKRDLEYFLLDEERFKRRVRDTMLSK